MLIKFGTEPQRDTGYPRDTRVSHSEEEEDDSKYHANSEVYTSSEKEEEEAIKEEKKKPTKGKKKKKNSSSPPLLLPFYEDYHMVEHSEDESPVERADKPRASSSVSGSDNESPPRPTKTNRKRKVDPDLVEGVLRLLNAAKESSSGRQEAKKGKSSEHQSAKAQAKQETTAKTVTGGGGGGRYTTVKSSLPKKTVKSLESISRQLCALQAKVDELTQNQ